MVIWEAVLGAELLVTFITPDGRKEYLTALSPGAYLAPTLSLLFTTSIHYLAETADMSLHAYVRVFTRRNRDGNAAQRAVWCYAVHVGMCSSAVWMEVL